MNDHYRDQKTGLIGFNNAPPRAIADKPGIPRDIIRFLKERGRQHYQIIVLSVSGSEASIRASLNRLTNREVIKKHGIGKKASFTLIDQQGDK